MTKYPHKDAETARHESCRDCRHDLGGGCCRINMEAECAAGGGYELYEEGERNERDGE